MSILLLTDFKKASAEEKLSLFNTLLKGYQEEVDNITKRAKFGENAFLNIYQKLYEAPDPYPALASIAVSIRLLYVINYPLMLNLIIFLLCMLQGNELDVFFILRSHVNELF